MNKQDFLSVIITFGTGFVAGVLLYMTGGAALDNKIEVPEVEKNTELSIVGDVYGGCSDGNACPSFQVLGDGSYRYYRTLTAGSEPILRQGTLPINLQNQLKEALIVEALTKQSQTIEPSVCNSYSDGIDVKYQITLDNVEYKIDSCGTAVDDNGALWSSLSAIWDYFESGGR